MTNYLTLLGHEPRVTGIVPSPSAILPYEVVANAHDHYCRVLLAEEKLYRFPLVVRMESVHRGGWRRSNHRQYRWMLYTLPSTSKLDEIEAELSELNRLRHSRNENLFPLMAADISTNGWHPPRLGGVDVTFAPVFVPAFRTCVM